MEIKDKVYEAYLKEKEEAKKEYDEAVSMGFGAGYIEQKARDSNQFTVSVNIEAQGKVNFNLTYEQLLTRTLQKYKHIVNINPGQIVQEMSVIVNINESLPIINVEVPDLKLTNDVEIEPSKKNPLAVVTMKDTNSAEIVWSPTPEQQKEIAKEGINGQLIVEYDVSRSDMQQILVEDGYFVHTFAPESLKPLPKHVCFVLDYSGSMLGTKIAQLKEAMDTILSDLSSEDFFSLVLFSNNAKVWSPKMDQENITTTVRPYFYSYDEPTVDQEVTKYHIIPVTPENIEAAKKHVNAFNDYGGTNIIAGLRNGLKLTTLGAEILKNSVIQPEPMIIFLTDGEPNIELSNPEEIIKKVKELNTDHVTIFSLAFGYGADVKFLKKLSFGNDGFHRVIYEAADAAAQLKNFYKEISSPLLSNITFQYVPNQVDEDTTTRIQFPTFFNGSEIVVAGKLKSQEHSGTIGELVGKGVNGTEMYPIIIDHPIIIVPPVEKKNRTVSRLEKVWAYLKIQRLLDLIDTLSNETAVNASKSEALELALKYKFVTPLTSLVVVKPNETTTADAEQVRPGMGQQSFASFARPSGFGGGGMAMPSYSYSMNHLSSASIGLAGAPGSGGFASSSGFGGGGMAMPAHSFNGFPPPMMPTIGGPSTPYRPTSPQDIVDENDYSERGTLDDLPWLFNYTSDNTTFTLPTVNGSINFLLGINETNSAFGGCSLPNGNIGECRHLEHCVLSEFYTGFDDFEPFQCSITGIASSSRYLGACCPSDTSTSTPVIQNVMSSTVVN